MLGDAVLYPGHSPEDIKANLQANSYTTENGTYERRLSPEEIQKGEKDYVQKNLQLKKIDKDFKAVQEEFKEKIKLIKDAADKKLESLRTGSETKEGKLYLIDDQERGLMYYYDEEGLLVNSRRLTPEERQTNFVTQSLTAAMSN